MLRRTGLQTNWTFFISIFPSMWFVSLSDMERKFLETGHSFHVYSAQTSERCTVENLNSLPRFSSSVWSVSLYIRYIHLSHPRNWLSFRWRSADERNRPSFFRKLSVDLFCVDLGSQRAQPPTVSCQSGVFLAITIFPWLVDRNSEYTCEISRWRSCKGCYSSCCFISLVHYFCLFYGVIGQDGDSSKGKSKGK